MSDKIDDGILEEQGGEEDFGPDIITLTSDDGEDYQFELLDREEIDGAEYVALVPIYGDDAQEFLEEDEQELVFMKVIEEDGEELLESLDDDDEYERVSAVFTERLSEFFDIQ